MAIDTHFLNRCIDTLDKAYGMLQGAAAESIEYEMYRSACVKEFEIILEQSGKLLRKCLKDYMHSPKAVDRLVFKEVFRYAAHHDFLTLEQAERWLLYRDNRNNTAHGFESDSGKKFAETTLELLADFIIDARALAVAVDQHQQRVSE